MSKEKQLSHLDPEGRLNMVNVQSKVPGRRSAVAEGRVFLPEAILNHLSQNELNLAKGPVFQTAIIAGIMAAKKTGELIPLCHPLGLDHIGIQIHLEGNDAVIVATASIEAKTGVEMEALTAVSLAALTIYDMCKALSHEMVIHQIRLIEKTGGKNDFKREA